MAVFQKDEVLQRFSQLDDDLLALYGTSSRFELVIVGGSALMVMGLASHERFTTDIDILVASKELEQLLERYDMNTDVSTYLYKYPENWQQRKKRIPFEGQVLDVYTLSNEDLAITKMLAWREVDKKDLGDLLCNDCLELSKIEGILKDVTEVQINLDADEYSSLMARWAELKESNLL